MFQALRQRAKTDSPRRCPGACSESPRGNATRLQEPAHCAVQVAFCLAIWKGAFCVPVLCPSFPWAEVPDGSYAQRCLPTAPHIQDRAPVCERQDRAGRRRDLSAWQISLKSSATARMLVPMQAVCFKKTGAFHLLSSIPFSCWFSFTQECHSTFCMPVCN